MFLSGGVNEVNEELCKLASMALSVTKGWVELSITNVQNKHKGGGEYSLKWQLFKWRNPRNRKQEWRMFINITGNRPIRSEVTAIEADIKMYWLIRKPTITIYIIYFQSVVLQMFSVKQHNLNLTKFV